MVYPIAPLRMRIAMLQMGRAGDAPVDGAKTRFLPTVEVGEARCLESDRPSALVGAARVLMARTTTEIAAVQTSEASASKAQATGIQVLPREVSAMVPALPSVGVVRQ